ncbi:LysR family transcriptional regulator [Piscinibacter sp. XHJ-5]|uniref:LysR family transcriptional regulator n=1 Tax=Piscinibacter sp. XHJ-5 TaxID=3037797 RepID=UPI0024537176|nr:LysR family transcriptional regulator [Piscinibacter sp. XHJ-5]
MKQLQGLLAFVEAAGTGSLTAAAERLEVTPAAVSKSLARLEEQLGVRLLNRSTRRIALTTEGAGFLDKARLALRALDDAVADVSHAARTPAGRVRISVGMSFGRRWVLPVLPALTQRHPELAIEVDLDNRPADLVAEGFDIGIRGGIVEDSSLVARRVCRLPLVLVASPAYLKQAGVPESVDDLGGHRCIALRYANTGTAPWRFKRPGGRRVDFTPDAALAVSDPEALIDLVLAHAGIAQTGLHHALPYLRSGRLKVVMHGLHDPGEREFVLHYPHRQYLAPRVRVVVEALLAHFAQSADLHLTAEGIAAYAAMPLTAQPASRRRNTRRYGSEAPASKR